LAGSLGACAPFLTVACARACRACPADVRAQLLHSWLGGPIRCGERMCCQRGLAPVSVPAVRLHGGTAVARAHRWAAAPGACAQRLPPHRRQAHCTAVTLVTPSLPRLCSCQPTQWTWRSCTMPQGESHGAPHSLAPRASGVVEHPPRARATQHGCQAPATPSPTRSFSFRFIERGIRRVTTRVCAAQVLEPASRDRTRGCPTLPSPNSLGTRLAYR